LRRAGHEVTVASNAEQALLAAGSATEPFELLISDVVMPGMSGVELSRALLTRSPALRVLLLSGYPGRDAPRADGRGMDYLAKPVTPQELLDRVDQLLGST
jgi:DNA-binding NtrC family response regulator